MDRKLVAIMGPTASGKTELAVALAERLPCEIVSVDSALVYRGLDIGSAKPEPEVLAAAPHRLVDIRDPWEPYSAAQFVADAGAACEAIWEAGRWPVLVGGTMLYFRALQDGLSPLPEADPQVREAIAAEAAKQGWPAVHARLAESDPQAAERIEPNDAQRIQRALEVLQLTGRTLTDLQRQQGRGRLEADWFKLAVSPAERAVLHQRIASRFDAMLATGFLGEMRRLHADPRLAPELPAMRSVGYRQGWEHLDGEYDLDTLRERVVAASRQLAKRQLTWLRREPELEWIDPTEQGWIDTAIGRIARFLDISM